MLLSGILSGVKKSNNMNWKKELPPSRENFPIRNTKTGKRGLGWYESSREWWYCYYPDKTVEDDLSIIEWLDESNTPPSAPVEGGKEVEDVFNEMSKEEIWRKWQSDKKQIGRYFKALQHYGITCEADIEKVAELHDINNTEQTEGEMYFKIRFVNCSPDYGHTFCHYIGEVVDYLETYGDDLLSIPSSRFIISGIRMTEKEYGDFIKKLEK